VAATVVAAMAGRQAVEPGVRVGQERSTAGTDLWNRHRAATD